MRRALTFTLWGLLGIGGVLTFGHLRQLLLEPQGLREANSGASAEQGATGAASVTEFLPTRVFPAFSPLAGRSPLPVPAEPAPDSAVPAIAIIIDDLGNQWQQSKRTLALQGDITLAILPFSPYGARLAELAERQGREVILHAPMEPLSHPAWRDGLRRDMNEQELRGALGRMLDALPTVRGVNNHMGSALTQERAAMNWVMDELAQRGLYFVDSRTSPSSQALVSAQQNALPSARRDVFLDNLRSPDAIKQQFRTLIHLAHKRGQAIAIGHPYPETLAFLEQALAQLENEGVRLVPVSHLLSIPAEVSTKPGANKAKPSPPLAADVHHPVITHPTKSI